MSRKPALRPTTRSPRKTRPAPAEQAVAPSPTEAHQGPPPQVRINIDPALTGGYIHDRYDVEMRGRVVSSAAIEEVALRLDGAVVARVQYGPADDSARTVPADGSGATQRGFRFNLPLRRAEASRACACVIAVRTQGGHTHEETIELSIDPASAVPLSVISGPTHGEWIQEEVRPPIVLYVERAVLDDGRRLLVPRHSEFDWLNEAGTIL